jgi:hypothetical protein
MRRLIKANGIVFGPKDGETKKLTADGTAQDTTMASALPEAAMTNGSVIGVLCSAATQLAFGDEAVTIGADDPAIPGGIEPQYMVVTGSHLGYKATNGTVIYIWYAGHVAS